MLLTGVMSVVAMGLLQVTGLAAWAGDTRARIAVDYLKQHAGNTGNRSLFTTTTTSITIPIIAGTTMVRTRELERYYHYHKILIAVIFL